MGREVNDVDEIRLLRNLPALRRRSTLILGGTLKRGGRSIVLFPNEREVAAEFEDDSFCG